MQTTLHIGAVALATSLGGLVHAQQQGLFFTGVPIGCVPAGDGGTYAVIANGADPVVIRMDANGTSDLQRQVVPASGDASDTFLAQFVLPDEEASVLLAASTTWELRTAFEDTLWFGQGFMRIDAQGTQQAHWRLEKRVFGNHQTLIFEPTLVTPDPNGGYYISWNYGHSGVTTELIRLDGQGQVLWAKSVGDPLPTWMPYDAAFPTISESTNGPSGRSAKLMCASNGDALLVNFLQIGGVCLSAKRLAANGDLLWSKDYCLSASTDPAMLCDAIVGQDGNIHVLLSHGLGQFFIAMEIAPSGALLAADAMSIIAGYMSYKILGEEDGDRWYVTSGNDRIYHLHEGGTIDLVHYGPTTQEPYEFTPTLFPGSVVDGEMRIMAMLERQHQVFGTAVNYPMLWKLPSADLAMCGSTTNFSNYSPVPLDNFTIVDDVNDLSIDISSYFTSTDGVEYLLTDPAILTFDPCAFQVGLEDVTAAAGLAMRTNLLASGEPVSIQGKPGQVVRMLDARGRLVQGAVQHSAVLELPTTALQPGMYVVVITAADGSSASCERLVIR